MIGINFKVLPTLKVLINVNNNVTNDEFEFNSLKLKLTVSDKLHTSISHSYEQAITSELGQWQFRLDDLHANEYFDCVVQIVNELDEIGHALTFEINTKTHSTTTYPEIIRQSIYEILKESDLNIPIYEDLENYCPISLTEDTPFSVLPLIYIFPCRVVQHKQLTPIRDELTIAANIVVYSGSMVADVGQVETERIIERIRGVLKKKKNLNLATLGVVDYSWEMLASESELLETENSAVFVFYQELTITVKIRPIITNITD